MKISELLKEVSNLFLEVCGIELYAVMKEDDSKILKRVNIADEDDDQKNTSEDLKNGFIEVVEDSLIREEDIEILKLSTADERKNAFFYYDLEDLPLEMKLLASASSDNESIQMFNLSEDKLDHIIGFIIAIGNSKNKIVLYKQQYPISLLKRDKYMLTPIPHQNRLKRYEGDILRMDFNYQFMLWNGTFYITDIDKMEKICSFHDVIRNEAIKSINKIKEIDIVDNIETLNDELDNITFARKLTRIYKDSKVLGKVSNHDIIEFTKRHSYFAINPINVNASGEKFVLDTKKAKNAFVKLMNDDLLTSPLTNADYESLAKNGFN